MIVKSLAESPTWLRGAVIDPKRFDTGYYDPSLTIAESHLRQGSHVTWKRLSKVGRVCNFGAYELTNQIRFVKNAERDAVAFITVTNITQLTVDFDSCPWIDRDSHRLLSASLCRPGIVLLSIAGTIGRAGVVPSHMVECNANQAIAKITVNEEESDPYFLAAYLSSRVGMAASQREAAGAVQKNLYIYNVEEIPVPCPRKSIRVAIGNKVRSAENLRLLAATSISTAGDRIAEFSGSSDANSFAPNEDGGCDFFASFVATDDLTLFHGAQFYSPKRQRVVDFVKATGISERIGSHSVRVRERAKRTSERDHIDPANVGGGEGYWSSGGEDQGGDVALAKPGDVLFLRMRPYLNKTTINDADKTVSASPEFLVYRFDEKDTYYAALCLRQPWALAQVAEIATGDRPRVDAEFVDDVVVPWPGEDTREEIGNLYKSSFALRRRADSLVQQAISDVDKLIEGTLDEAECVQQGRQLGEEFALEVPQ